ncbi:hypothetical protein NECID01_1327 [Nematocida sp. AWRm77]|nr:hypothetical protein NECID01_1327 [Nematocida sp. AWRm77]
MVSSEKKTQIIDPSTGITVKFKLGDKEPVLTSIIPRGAFGIIDAQEKYLLFIGKRNQRCPCSNSEEERQIPLPLIHTQQEYEYFKAFWEGDLSEDSTKTKTPLLRRIKGLKLSLFDSFLITADQLDIQGEYAQFFAANMVRYGLLGKCSKYITSKSQYQPNEMSYRIVLSMLSSFLGQIGLKAKTIVHSDAKKKMLLIEKANVWRKKTNEEYTKQPQKESIRAVLYSELGPTGSKEKKRNETVFGWLLSNMGGFSVDIQYSIDITSKETTELTQTVRNLTKKDEKDRRAYVEGLTLSIEFPNNASLLPAFQNILDISRLKMIIYSPYASDEVLDSLFSSFSRFESLKDLEIGGQVLNSALFSPLVKNIPIVKRLSFSCRILEGKAIDDIKYLSHLEILEMDGVNQPKAVVQALVRHALAFKELTIKSQALDSTIAKSFQACKNLEKLEIYGENQPSAVVQALVEHTLTLKDLIIRCHALDFTAANSFQACKNLEKLEIYGEGSVSFLVKLLEILPSLQNLRIIIDTANLLPLANALRKSPNMRSLTLTAMQYTPGFLEHYLQDPLPQLAYLKIYNLDKHNNYSNKDDKAVEEASAKGIQIAKF